MSGWGLVERFQRIRRVLQQFQPRDWRFLHGGEIGAFRSDTGEEVSGSMQKGYLVVEHIRPVASGQHISERIKVNPDHDDAPLEILRWLLSSSRRWAKWSPVKLPLASEVAPSFYLLQVEHRSDSNTLLLAGNIARIDVEGQTYKANGQSIALLDDAKLFAERNVTDAKVDEVILPLITLSGFSEAARRESAFF
jgi:hypothetical protein